jgi:chemotaxis family two-component system response regulator Rcp1
MPDHRPLRILQVEDTQGDAQMTALAMKAGKIPHILQVVTDGVQAIDYLTKKDPFADAARPDLILLDLDLPRLKGDQVLEFIKGEESLREIPVIIFSSHDSAESKHHAYQLHANSYVVKPQDLEAFTSKVQSIADYWCNTSEAPIARTS